MEATNSVALSIYDPSLYLVHASGTVAESSTTTVNFGGTALDRPLYGTSTLIAVSAGTESATRAVVYTIKVTK